MDHLIMLNFRFKQIVSSGIKMKDWIKKHDKKNCYSIFFTSKYHYTCRL